MTRYADVDEPGGPVAQPGYRLPGPRSAGTISGDSGGTGDTDWQLSKYLHGPDDAGSSGLGIGDAGTAGADTGGWRASRAARKASQPGQPSKPGKKQPGRVGGPPPSSPPARARFLRGRRGKWLAGVAIVAMVGVVGTSLVAYAQYRSVLGSIHRETVTAAMLGHRPPYTAGLNILVIGSDSRAGLGHKFGTDVLGARSDTSMLLHIAPGHTRADVISFPRDSMVPILACSNDGQGHTGQTAQSGLERLNATFSAGGAPCLWKTLEQTTGIRIQHFVEVNFAGFESIVNDVHGVPVCLPFAINNAQSRLHLSAGKHVVTGAQALAFVRLREDIGEGSDTQRIQRQQYFLAAVMQKLKTTGLLSQPTQIYAVVRDVAKSLTTDSGLDLNTMLRIATSMKSLSSSAVQFITVPVVPYVGDPAAELSWEQPQADRLFRAVEADRELPTATKGKKKATVPTVSPAKVSVNVLNGSGVTGIAGSTASALTGKGFKVASTGPAPNYSFTSNVIEYSSAAQLPEVNTLKAQFSSVAVKQNAALNSNSLTLILGSSFQGLSTASGSSGSGKSASQKLNSLAKSYGGITANTNICSDAAAFEGPDSPLPGG
jgi:LCP family protein required for cell wall assembly